LKLKCDEPLSNVAFHFNLRRYTTAMFVAFARGHSDVVQAIVAATVRMN
jgi:phosphate/sulfate permease